MTVDAERARTEADAADAALARGEVRGPLHGVPMTIKDSFQTAGMQTTSGAPELAEFVPKEAWPVARLREAGAIVFGKTNLPIYASDLQSYNEIFGTTNNPYDVSHTPGGLIRRIGRRSCMRIHSSGTRQRYRRFDSSPVSYVGCRRP